MEPTSEKQFNTKSTYDTFDEIYTNYDLSVDRSYSAATGYPFDYPIRWLNDISMNKRIAIRRLDATPSSHSFKLFISAKVGDVLPDDDSMELKEYYHKNIIIDITYQDTLIKVMNFITNSFKYENQHGQGGLIYKYDSKNNTLSMKFFNSFGVECPFLIGVNTNEDQTYYDDLDEFLKFLNQPLTEENRDILTELTTTKTFHEVWDRNRLHFHASFSTSHRHFIGKRGDFYQNLSLLYPTSNETTFNIRFTTDGYKNILLRYADFEVQLCFIVNYMKSIVL